MVASYLDDRGEGSDDHILVLVAGHIGRHMSEGAAKDFWNRDLLVSRSNNNISMAHSPESTQDGTWG